MKKLFILIVCAFSLLSQFKAQTYSSLNISLLAHLDPETDNTGSEGRKYSGCWGWYQAAKSKEYALVGTSKQTYFIDVTNPNAPVVVDSVRARHTGCTWREIKTYQNYCYMVSDQCNLTVCKLLICNTYLIRFMWFMTITLFLKQAIPFL